MIIKDILRQDQDNIHFHGKLSCPIDYHEGVKSPSPSPSPIEGEGYKKRATVMTWGAGMTDRGDVLPTGGFSFFMFLLE
jgi:hypothetical protein